MLCCCLPLLLAAGCWDRVEVEQRGFVIGAAIDLLEDEQLRLTYQFGVPGGMKTAGGQSRQLPYMNISSEAHTVFKAARQMANETSRPPYLEHNRIIILSEAVAKSGSLGDVLDPFIRDAETRRAAKVMVAAGEASELLSFRPPNEVLPAQYIDSAAENPDKSEAITPPTNIGDVHGFLLRHASFALPKITLEHNRVLTSGAAVFNGYDHQMRGFLNNEETTGRNFITGELKAGALEVRVDGEHLVFEIKKHKRRLRADISEPTRPEFDVTIEVEGNLGESHLENRSVLSPELLKEAERKAEQEVLRLTDTVIRKVQQTYKSDIFGMSEHLYENHYAVWQQLKDNWDHGVNYFSTCTIRVQPKVKLRVVGSIQKAE